MPLLRIARQERFLSSRIAALIRPNCCALSRHAVSVALLLASAFCHSLHDYQKHDLKQFHGEATLRFGMLIAIALVALTNVAMAQSKHPQDVQKINAALPTAKITPAQRAQVIKLRNEGEAFHSAGQHGKAEVVLEQAKAILRVR